ncbi:D-isomer specific 2-hydroxyacid dehydrogenase family protein [Fervidibacillus albus]|uniref:D-isomer specific 2-hydroxyacid dehydrogenase family protein n=1 Tax=Fervidibacillus albus TaxID=2980026 RepID=A0A9E8RV63_9BACI|nr:D-isomer specific 2-hydroxyacid dehydrogenase family protein [Fervidibacillus albus]WAA09121.1 D-isomer specific 2-hydroxyacid dehydrogenase family protein [Fervidibacillus albus]
MDRKNKIAIVNSSSFGTIFPEHLERLHKLGEVEKFTLDSELDGKTLAEKLYGFNMIIASITPFYTKEFFEHKDELKLITRHGIGYNNIDLEAAKKHHTIVSIVPPLVERDAVAENNITNLLNVMRQTSKAYQAVLQDKWEERAKFVGNILSGKTAGVIGVGNIGSRVAELLNYGFRCEVLGYDPYKTSEELEAFGAKKVELEELLQRSDVICICASLNEFNYHMLSEKEFNMMKRNVYLSNTARGALIDESALVSALDNGKVAGFATDVLEVEPGRSNHPYVQFSNVIMTPHTSAYTMECLEGMGNKCVTDCEKVAKGILPDRSIQTESKYLI